MGNATTLRFTIKHGNDYWPINPLADLICELANKSWLDKDEVDRLAYHFKIELV